MNENIKKYLDDKLTYFSKGGYDFEIIKMSGEENILKIFLVVSKNGNRIKWGGGNPYVLSSPPLDTEKGARESLKELIFNMNG